MVVRNGDLGTLSVLAAVGPRATIARCRPGEWAAHDIFAHSAEQIHMNSPTRQILGLLADVGTVGQVVGNQLCSADDSVCRRATRRFDTSSHVTQLLSPSGIGRGVDRASTSPATRSTQTQAGVLSGHPDVLVRDAQPRAPTRGCTRPGCSPLKVSRLAPPSPGLLIELAISAGAVGDIVAKHAAAAGVREDRRTAHALRHTFCTMLAERGVALEAISALAGHVDVRTTQIYVDVSDQRKGDGISALEHIPDPLRVRCPRP